MIRRSLAVLSGGSLLVSGALALSLKYLDWGAESQTLIGCIAVLYFLLFYASPGLYTVMNHRQGSGHIIAVNLLLGWTVVGWVIAFLWAYRAKPQRPQNSQEARGCPVCGYTRKRLNSDLAPLITNRKAAAEVEYRNSDVRVDPVSPPFRRRG